MLQTQENNMIKRVITIGSDSKCDFVINRTTMPTLMDYIIERIKPIHAQIIQDDDEYYLNPFSDYIYINGCGITSEYFKQHPYEIKNGLIKLDFEDELSFGLDVFWQQWMVGLGLNCGKCKYREHSVRDDGWCKFCRERHFNPSPYIYGFSRQFDYDNRGSGFYNYTDCKKCGYKPDWCVECTFFLEPQPKNNSFKEHVDMYIQRLDTYNHYKDKSSI